MLGALIDCWDAANRQDSEACQRLGKRLNLKVYDYYFKPELVLLSERMGFNWREIDNGVWSNTKGGVPLTPEEIAVEIARNVI